MSEHVDLYLLGGQLDERVAQRLHAAVGFALDN